MLSYFTRNLGNEFSVGLLLIKQLDKELSLSCPFPTPQLPEP